MPGVIGKEGEGGAPDGSIAKARDWVAKNAVSVGAAAPTVFEGLVVIHVK